MLEELRIKMGCTVDQVTTFKVLFCKFVKASFQLWVN